MKRYRLAAMLTTAAMTVSFYGITVSAADDAIEKSWDGSYDTSWYDEQDTELHIFTAEELAGLAYLVNDGKKTFEGQTVFLESDVDLNGAEWPVIGYVGKEYGTFQGVFNGNNHLIANLTINEDRTYVGLFGYCENASIVNTRLADLNIYRRGRLSISQVSGGICSVFDNGTIENCQVQGKIRSAAGIGGIVSVAKNSNIRRCVSDIITNGGGVKQSVGGICGNAANTTFEECAALGTHKLELISYNLDDMYFAGICGKGDDKIIIKNCYSQFDISVSTISSYHDGDVDLKKGNIGGIVGVLPSGSIVENVFNAGILSTTGNAGGVICNNSNGTSVSNAYYLSSTASKGVANGEDSTIAKSAANMKKESFANLLGDAFVYVEGSFPKLAWELENGPEKTGTSITEAKLKVGESTQMTVTNYKGSITWVSQNPEILMINSEGVATGLKAGKATIFAIIESGKALSGTIEVLPADYITGDCNGDGEFDISDVVSLQKWLITEESSLRIWKAADLSNDGLLSSIDLSLMKNILLSKTM